MIHIELYKYNGKDFDEGREEGVAFGVVEKLVTDSRLLNKGFPLYTDNFYIKPRIASL